MALRTSVIVNPTSANGATGRQWPELRRALDRVLERWDQQFTLGPGDATRLARQAVLEGYDMLVSVGGDGTMQEVVTGLFAEDPAGIGERLLRPDLILGSVRQGTGGDFARYLGLPGALPDCVAHLAGERARPCDLGLITHQDFAGRTTRRAFLNIASFGMSGLVVDRVNSSSKALGGRASFLLGLGKALLAYRPQGVRVRVDGAVVHEGPVVTCAVANGQYFGGGMRMAARAEIDDGLLDVVVQLRSGLREIAAIGDLYSGRIADWSSVRYIQGKEISAEPLAPDARVLLEVDGEGSGMLPASFRVVPSAIRLKVP